MIRPRLLLRLFTIQWVLMRHGLDELLFATPWFKPLRFMLWLSPWRLLGRTQRPRGERLRLALEELGPIFVKFGQALSTRRDLLPEDVADELAKLQDRVPPFPGPQARALIEKSLGKPITELFLEFDETPLASASIAQVHPARLPDGSEVVVKVVRPNILPIIERDLEILHTLAGLAERASREPAACTPWTWCGTSTPPCTTSWIWCARRPMPASWRATSKVRTCCTSRSSTGPWCSRT